MSGTQTRMKMCSYHPSLLNYHAAKQSSVFSLSAHLLAVFRIYFAQWLWIIYQSASRQALALWITLLLTLIWPEPDAEYIIFVIRLVDWSSSLSHCARLFCLVQLYDYFLLYLLSTTSTSKKLVQVQATMDKVKILKKLKLSSIPEEARDIFWINKAHQKVVSHL